MFTITVLPRVGNKQEINILGAEFSRFAELEAQKFSYVNMQIFKNPFAVDVLSEAEYWLE